MRSKKGGALQRLTSLDVLRGMTIAGMILVNNPGGGEENAYAPLLHAEWIGLTPTDLVFPFFMFIMGITTYLSLSKRGFAWSGKVGLKVVRRALSIWLIGLGITWLFMFTRGMLSEDNASLGFMERLITSASCLDHIRILGVMPRLGICYGLAATIALTVRHRFIPWIIALLFAGYYVMLAFGNGFVHDATNIVAVVDDLVLGNNHVYRWESPDPEGLLSTIPALAHVLLGFWVGRKIMEKPAQRATDGSMPTDICERLFGIGCILMVAGWLLSYGCPMSKKLWTPTFSMMTCGMASTLLALLTRLMNGKVRVDGIVRFFEVFGVNPLAMFIISDLLLLPFSVLPLCGGQTVQQTAYETFATVMPNEAASLLWALIYIAINWLCALWMHKKNWILKL